MSETNTRFTRYQWWLLFLLSVATFFEGFDFLAISQILPQLRAEFGLSRGQGGDLVAFTNIGTIFAYLIVRLADRWGRRRVLTLTILGYTVSTVASGLAPDVWTFGAAQLCGRMFLIGEWAVAMVYAAEEMPAAKRGLAIGIIQGASSLGSIVCAGVVPRLLETRWGWRSVFFVGAVPLVLLAFARSGLRESGRFVAAGQAIGSNEPRAAGSLGALWRSAYRGRMLRLALIWALTYMCTQTAIVFFKEFAREERGMTDGEIGLILVLVSIGAIPVVFAAGKLIDLVGRRRGAVVIFSVTTVGVAGAYLLPWRAPLAVALCLGVIGASTVLTVLNAYTTELFPTAMRSDAFAWSNNLLGRIGYVIAPLAVGHAADVVGWGRAVASTSVFPLVALALILWWLPETRGRELEDTSSLA